MDATQLNSVIDKLAEKLAVPTERLIQAYAVGGYANMATAVTAFVISLGVVCILSVHLCATPNHDEDWASIFTVISGFCLLASVIGIVTLMPMFLVWHKSPEAYAIQTLIQQLR